MTRLEPPLPLDTPKGPAWAHFAIHSGAEHHIYWVVFLDADGACWTFENPDIRMQHNNTLGRHRKPIEWRKQWATSPAITEPEIGAVK